MAVESIRRVVVADGVDALAHQVLGIDDGRRADLAGDDHDAGLDHRLAGNASVRVLLEDGIEDRVRYLVCHLVRMALGNRLRGDQLSARHGLPV